MIDAALDHLREYFAHRTNRAGLLARAWLGTPTRDDDRHRHHLVSAIGARVGADGSLDGNMLGTAVAVLELDQLDARGGPRDRMVAWLLQQQGRPGSFPDGCTAARHQHRVCEHFLSGFFAPASPAQRAAPVTLSNGKELRTESHARFALSCVALEAVVRSGRLREAMVERHLDSFGALVNEWAVWGDHLPPDLAFSALAALAAAGDRGREPAVALVEVIAARQLSDGTWPQTDFFHALDGLSRLETAPVEPVLERAAATLLLRQRDDGSFGSVAADERALIGARVLTRLAARRGSGVTGRNQ